MTQLTNFCRSPNFAATRPDCFESVPAYSKNVAPKCSTTNISCNYNTCVCHKRSSHSVSTRNPKPFYWPRKSPGYVRLPNETLIWRNTSHMTHASIIVTQCKCWSNNVRLLAIRLRMSKVTQINMWIYWFFLGNTNALIADFHIFFHNSENNT